MKNIIRKIGYVAWLFYLVATVLMVVGAVFCGAAFRKIVYISWSVYAVGLFVITDGTVLIGMLVSVVRGEKQLEMY